jgi:hypothetical protein
MNLNLRPLSELYREDQRRLNAREVDAIVTLHRASFEAHLLLAEAERLNPTKEFLS